MEITARNLCAQFVAKILIMLGLVRQVKKKALNGEYILSICFHKPSKKEFESCIRWLQKNKFHFLSTSDLDRIILGELPFPKGGVLLTVDDGWQSNATNVVPIANQYAVPVTIFVSTEPVEVGLFWWSYWLKGNAYVIRNGVSVEDLKRVPNQERLLIVEQMKKVAPVKRNAMTVEQIKTVSATNYITIGGHTHTHPILVNCNDDEVQTELQLSRQKLEQWTGKEVAYFAYPNGDYNSREIQMLKEFNWRLAFSVDKERYLTPDELKNHYMIPRFSFLEGASFAENICHMAGVWKFFIKWPKQGTSIVGKLIHKLFPTK
jgi:peptidoglycan/xylan/chitin deacetylase (PgdA/CDA1 family)